MRRLAIVGLLLGAILGSACGGGDGDSGNDPTPAFPNVDGVWNIQGTFNAFASTLAHFEGTVTIDQPSRNAAPITATTAITVLINGGTSSITQISEPTITEAGDLAFNLHTANVTTTWAFTGTLSGTVANGTHVLAGGGSSFPGVWQATKQ